MNIRVTIVLALMILVGLPAAATAAVEGRAPGLRSGGVSSTASTAATDAFHWDCDYRDSGWSCIRWISSNQQCGGTRTTVVKIKTAHRGYTEGPGLGFHHWNAAATPKVRATSLPGGWGGPVTVWLTNRQTAKPYITCLASP